MYWIKVHEIPEASRSSRGSSVKSLIQLSPDEEISTIVTMKDYTDQQYIFMSTANGTVKKCKTTEFANAKTRGVIGIKLHDGDHLVSAMLTSGNDDAMLITRKILLKRGNVVWVDFGFNIGNEFGGMHPAVILKNFDNELFVVPISSKKPKEYIKIEQDLEDEIITEEECKRRKEKINSILQIDSIYRFKEMTRWVDITRIKKVSLLRLNYSGTIGKISGNYINSLSNKISKEF